VPRDAELYALAEADPRVFFPGGHAGKARAVQALLRPGFAAIWHDRSDARRVCGFVTVRRGDEGWHLERVPPEAWTVTTGAAAWALLAAQVEPEVLGDVAARLLEPPATREDAVALASAPATMRAAEALVREAFARAAALGAGPCPPVLWRAMPLDVCARSTPVRTAFDGRWAPYREALGGAVAEPLRRGRAMLSLSRYDDPPPLLRFAAEDLGEALTFDALRERGFVSTRGLAFAALENPFEPLLRAGRIGIVVHEVTPTRVVLGACD
jgi:hypothetical protein